jgi:copper chaperone CopZ
MEHLTFAATGMSCQHCVQTVTAAVVQVPGVAGVTVDLEAGTVTVDTLQPVDPQAVADAITAAGYPASLAD